MERHCWASQRSGTRNVAGTKPPCRPPQPEMVRLHEKHPEKSRDVLHVFLAKQSAICCRNGTLRACLLLFSVLVLCDLRALRGESSFLLSAKTREISEVTD
jgi:hypothetical protein